MRVGARNRIVGRVTRIDKGKVMGLVKLEVTGPHMMASALTVESLKEMGLRKGDEVEIVVKAVSVLLIKR